MMTFPLFVCAALVVLLQPDALVRAEPVAPTPPPEYSVTCPVYVRVTALPGLMVGDVSMDGAVTMGDVMYLMQSRAGLRTLDEYQLQCADTNADGQVTMGDAMHIMQFRADPHKELGILYKPLYDPVFHSGMIDPLSNPY